MAIDRATEAGSAVSVAKDTTVIPTHRKAGWYTVTHNGLTYDYYASYSAGLSGGTDIAFYNTALEDYNSDGTAATSKLDTWNPPPSFFPPDTLVTVYNTGDSRADGRVDIVEQFVTAKKKKKPKETPDLGNAPVMTLDDFGLGKLNPPPHKTSRTLPPTAFPNYSTTDTANSVFTQLESANNRGYFYQDLDGEVTSASKQKAQSKLWGFQFMYNPTTIGYTNQANSSVDHLNPDDIASLLVGSQSINFEILINRTADVSALKTTAIPGTADYPRALTYEEAVNLRKRGTEYDIEFLYRCINGDPQLTDSMLEPTADYGYLAGLPIWLRFNNNVKYKGIINSLSVEHVMFSENMVPMLSKVSLSFLRMPTPKVGATDEDLKDFYTKQFSKVPNFSGAARTTNES